MDNSNLKPTLFDKASLAEVTHVVRADTVLITFSAFAHGTRATELLVNGLEEWALRVRAGLPCGASAELHNFSIDDVPAPPPHYDHVERSLQQTLLDMQASIAEAKRQVAVAVADEKRLAKQATQEKERAADWEEKALLAIKEGKGDLAKQVILRKHEHEKRGAGYELQWKEQAQAVAQMKDALHFLDTKLDEAKRKMVLLVARARRAEAQKTIAENMIALGASRLDQRLDEIERAVAGAEAGVAGEALVRALAGGLGSLALSSLRRAVRRSTNTDKASEASADPPFEPRERVARLELQVSVPLAETATVLERAHAVAALDDLVCASSSSTIRVRPALPVFMVANVERYRAVLVERAHELGAVAVEGSAIVQTSFGSERVSLRLGEPNAV